MPETIDNETVLYAVAVILALIISGLFSMAETALTAASRPNMHLKEKLGDRRAKTVNALRHDSESLIGALLLGNNMVNILATAVTTSLLTALFGEAGIAYATILMTVAVLIFSEVMPKMYAFNHADAVAVAIAPAVRIWLWLSWPVTWTVRRISNALLRLIGGKTTVQLGRFLSDDELRGAIELHGTTPDREDVHHEKIMMRSILDLDAVSVAQVMTYRRNVNMLDIETPPKALVQAVLDSPFTRIPLWQDDPNNIVGVLHAKALLRAIQDHPDPSTLDIKALAASPWFIPDTANLLDQLHAFRERREHFALVVDEYGAFMGIITLEDILEEIVGEIADELDAPVTGVRRQPDGTFQVQGNVAVRDLNREFDWNLPTENATTLAGLILWEARLLPDVGQVFTFYGFRFEILRRQRNQITLVRLRPPVK